MQNIKNNKNNQYIQATVTSSYLLQRSFRPFPQHDTGYNSAQEENESIDEASHAGILTVGTATTQQTRGTTAEAWNLQ